MNKKEKKKEIRKMIEKRKEGSQRNEYKRKTLEK